jgi:hypothetical protein
VSADNLLATSWTNAGDAASSRSDPRSPLPLRERIEAVAAALESTGTWPAMRYHGLAALVARSLNLEPSLHASMRASAM